jgi:hypothetical protein
MGKKSDKKVVDISGILVELNFNQNHTEVELKFTRDTPIKEDEIVLELMEFLAIFGDGFNYAEIGQFVPFDLIFDEDEDGKPTNGIYH